MTQDASKVVAHPVAEAIDDLIRHLAEAAGVTEAEALTAMREGRVIEPRRRKRKWPKLLCGGLLLFLATVSARCAWLLSPNTHQGFWDAKSGQVGAALLGDRAD